MSIPDERGSGKAGRGGRMADLLVILVVVLALAAAFGLGILARREMGQGESEERVWIEQLSAGQGSQPAAAITAPVPEAVPTTGMYVGSKSGTKYHLPSCSGAKRIKEENKVWFATKEEATAAGYTPAANCPGL